MRTRERRRPLVALAAAITAIAVAACGGTTAVGSTLAGSAGESATPETAALTVATPAPLSGASPSPNPGTIASPAASSPAATPAPPASPTLAPLPTPGPARTFSCASLASNGQVSKATGVQVRLFDLSQVPGVTLPRLPKGETECKFLGGGTGPGKVILTVDVTILTDGARATFDKTWRSFRGTPLVSTVPGLADDAAWFDLQDTLVGLTGATAFVITLEPLPADYFKSAAARTAAVAIARAVLAHI
jgi:hypothetical protein